jgi:hypothetical protein
MHVPAARACVEISRKNEQYEQHRPGISQEFTSFRALTCSARFRKAHGWLMPALRSGGAQADVFPLPACDSSSYSRPKLLHLMIGINSVEDFDCGGTCATSHSIKHCFSAASDFFQPPNTRKNNGLGDRSACEASSILVIHSAQQLAFRLGAFRSVALLDDRRLYMAHIRGNFWSYSRYPVCPASIDRSRLRVRSKQRPIDGSTLGETGMSTAFYHGSDNRGGSPGRELYPAWNNCCCLYFCSMVPAAFHPRSYGDILCRYSKRIVIRHSNRVPLH